MLPAVTPRLAPLALIAAAGLALPMAAQSPCAEACPPAEITLSAGVVGSLGCQNTTSPPTLTGGVAATATVNFTYNAASVDSGVLTMCVTNTSPVVTGEFSPVLTSLSFNVPLQGIIGVGFLRQCTPQGAQPGFVASTDLNPIPALTAGCFGGFNVRLSASANGGALGSSDPSANFVQTNVATGTAKLSFLVLGPGAPTLNARAIANAFSQNATLAPANVALNFAEGGASGTESGILNAIDETLPVGTANPSLYTTMPAQAPRLPGLPPIIVDLIVAGTPGSHGCLFVSRFGGPTNVAGLVDPLPLGSNMLNEILAIPVGPFPSSGWIKIPVPVTNEIYQILTQCVTQPAQSERCIYFALAAFFSSQVQAVGAPPDDVEIFIPRFDMRVRLKPIE